MYKLHTNEGTRYVRSTPERLRAAMFQYIKAKRQQGVPLANITFCWTRIHLGAI